MAEIFGWALWPVAITVAVVPWVAFFRTDVATPWTGTTPPPRAERARADVAEAIGLSRELLQPPGDCA